MSDYDGNQLIGTGSLPAGYKQMRVKAREMRTYNEMNPYPQYGLFREWKVQERGPIPRCWPLSRDIVTTSAEWLFGKGIKFKTEDEDTTEFVTDIWNQNKMPVKMLRASRRAGYEGGAALAWSYQPEETFLSKIGLTKAGNGQVQIVDYSVANHVKFYYDPHDDERLVMARIQYPFHEPKEDRWMLFREDWTETKVATYEPVDIKVLSQDNPVGVFHDYENLDDRQFGPPSISENPAGLIPVQEIKHIDTGKPYGEGDLWALTQLVDLHSLTRHVENVDNQIAAWPHIVYIDLQAEEGEEPRASGPDAVTVLQSTRESRGDVKSLESGTGSREAIRQHADDLEDSIRRAAGNSKVDVDAVTNKGSMTSAVMAQLYQVQIASTNAKRRNYGEYGISPFLEGMVEGLRNAGHPVASDLPEDVEIEVVWPEFFELIPSELQAMIQNQRDMIESGLTTPERAVTEIAAARQIDSVKQLLEDIEAHATEEDNEDNEDNTAHEENTGHKKTGS